METIKETITPEEIIQVLTKLYLSKNNEEKNGEKKIWQKIFSSNGNLQIFLDCFFDMQFAEYFEKRSKEYAIKENNIYFYYFKNLMKFDYHKKTGELVIANTEIVPTTLSGGKNSRSNFIKSISTLLWEEKFPNCIFYITYSFNINSIEITLKYQTPIKDIVKNGITARIYSNNELLEEKQIPCSIKNAHQLQEKIPENDYVNHTFFIPINEIKSFRKSNVSLKITAETESPQIKEVDLIKTKIKIGDK